MREDLEAVDARLAARLAGLRAERGWSLDELAGLSGVSRSTLSRVERAEISPTAALLGRLGSVYGLTMSRLLSEVEGEPPELVRAAAQTVWHDPDGGFTRRAVSPPHRALRAEVVESRLEPGTTVAYDAPPLPGIEHHLWVLSGEVTVAVGDAEHTLREGDCLRYRLWGPSRFRCPGPDPARYAVVVVLP
jgi:transcriptional regulator with XRE-family HTH domain